MKIGANSSSRDRIPYVDNLRWFGIVLVYLGHFLDKLIPSGYSEYLWLHNFIYSFHMPLFFFLSGIFWKPENSSTKKIVGRAVILLVPAMFWSFAYLPFNLATMSQAEFFNTLARYPFGHFDFFHPSWFLVCLFMVEVILSMFSRILKGLVTFTSRIVLIVSAFLIGFIFDVYQPLFQEITSLEVSFWYLGEAFPAIGFYLAGSILKDDLKAERKSSISSMLVLLVIISIWMLSSKWMIGSWVETNIYIDMSVRQYGNYFGFIALAFLGIASSFLLFRLRQLKSKLLRFVGENSVVFYLLNGLNIFVLDNFVLALGWVPTNPIPVFLFSIGYAIASQIAFIPLAYLLIRYSPLLVGRYKFAKLSPSGM
ncbi:MAG: acyltransferase family protein [Anaerolineales bacterium]|nr:acyltransferase family protein [Anaerolineales bacterium]